MSGEVGGVRTWGAQMSNSGHGGGPRAFRVSGEVGGVRTWGAQAPGARHGGGRRVPGEVVTSVAREAGGGDLELWQRGRYFSRSRARRPAALVRQADAILVQNAAGLGFMLRAAEGRMQHQPSTRSILHQNRGLLRQQTKVGI